MTFVCLFSLYFGQNFQFTDRLCRILNLFWSKKSITMAYQSINAVLIKILNWQTMLKFVLHLLIFGLVANVCVDGGKLNTNFVRTAVIALSRFAFANKFILNFVWKYIYQTLKKTVFIDVELFDISFRCFYSRSRSSVAAIKTKLEYRLEKCGCEIVAVWSLKWDISWVRMCIKINQCNSCLCLPERSINVRV